MSILELNKVINQNYKYGFTTKMQNQQFPKGLNKKIIKLIHTRKQEPDFLLDFRYKAYQNWLKMKPPIWGNLNIKEIDAKYYKAALYSHVREEFPKLTNHQRAEKMNEILNKKILLKLDIEKIKNKINEKIKNKNKL